MPWFQQFQKEIKNVFKIMKPQLCCKPCMILKRLDENCSRCNLKLLYIIYQYFKISNIYQKFMRPSIQAQAVMLVYYRRAPHDLKRLNENRRRSCVYHLQYIIPLFKNSHKFAKNTKMVRWSKEAKSRPRISYFIPVWNWKTIRLKLLEKMHFPVTIHH